MKPPQNTELRRLILVCVINSLHYIIIMYMKSIKDMKKSRTLDPNQSVPLVGSAFVYLPQDDTAVRFPQRDHMTDIAIK